MNEKVILKEVKERGNYGSAEIVCVNLGNSTAVNYCIKTPEIRLFAKVYSGTNDIRFRVIEYICDNNINLIRPLYDFQVDKQNRCMVMRWISGKDIYIKRKTAESVASILKALHDVPVPKEIPRSNIREEVDYYIQFINSNGINFKYKDIILYYVEHNIGVCRDIYAFTHMDIHLKNFIQSENQIYVIDYENLSVTDPWRDFVYAVCFHDRIEDDFWMMVICQYFENLIPSQFWCVMKYYCYIQLLRMIICEYKKGNKYRIEEIVMSIYKEFSLEIDKPRWTENYYI